MGNTLELFWWVEKFDKFHIKLGHFAISYWESLHHYYNTNILQNIYTQFMKSSFYLTFFSNACNSYT